MGAFAWMENKTMAQDAKAKPTVEELLDRKSVV
jgi:hypothetical protein